LQRAEVWLRNNPLHPELLRILGSLCLRGQLWGPATSYLTRSLAQRDDPRTHALLGSLYDLLEKPQEASRHWRLATAAVVGLTVLDRAGALPAAETQADPQRVAIEASDFVGDEPGHTRDASPADLRTLPQPSATPDEVDDYELGAADLPPRDLPDVDPLKPDAPGRTY